MRYLTPLIFFAAAGFVWNYNETHTDSYVLFPFLDLIPALTGDLEAQAGWSWKLFVGLGVLLLFWTVLRDLTRKKKVVEAKVAPEDEQEK